MKLLISVPRTFLKLLLDSFKDLAKITSNPAGCVLNAKPIANNVTGESVLTVKMTSISQITTEPAWLTAPRSVTTKTLPPTLIPESVPNVMPTVCPVKDQLLLTAPSVKT